MATQLSAIQHISIPLYQETSVPVDPEVNQPSLSGLPKEYQHLATAYCELVASVKLHLQSDEKLLRICVCCQPRHLVREFGNTSEQFRELPFESSIVQQSSLGLQMQHNLQELDTLLQKIRGIEGFETFQKLPSVSGEELRTAHIVGPTVIINATRFGSHAVLLHEKATEAITLDSLSLRDVESWYKWFNEHLDCYKLKWSGSEEACCHDVEENKSLKEMLM